MRDHRLDFWRGLCLVDMVLVHLAYEGVQFGLLTGVVAEYARFAAGGFVFVAGVSVARVLLARAGTGAVWPVYRIAWARAAYVLGVHYAATASFVALDLMRGYRAPGEDVGTLLAEIILLRDATPYGDILPLYVVMLAVTPVLLASVRRGLQLPLVAASVGLFIAGGYHPWALSFRVGEAFPAILWQAVFVAGLVFGAWLPRFDALERRHQARVATAACGLSALVFVAAHPRLFGIDGSVIPLVFVKVPLSAGELLRYLTMTMALLLVTAVCWSRVERTRLAAAVATLGRRSLAVYVAHVWVQAAVVAVAVELWWIGAFQAGLALGAVGALVAFAYGLERYPSIGFRGDMRIMLRSWGAPPAGIAVAAVALLVVTRVIVPTVDGGRPDADVSIEAIADLEIEDVSPALLSDVELIDVTPDPADAEYDAGRDDVQDELDGFDASRLPIDYDVSVSRRALA